jgi:hypothetical protein
MRVIGLLLTALACLSCASKTETLSLETRGIPIEKIDDAFPEMWIGHYEGAGQLYTRSEWRSGQIARISIFRMRGEADRYGLAGVIKKHRSETHAPGFSIEDIDLSSTTELVGEFVRALWRYEYRIRRVDDRLQGEVSAFEGPRSSPKEIWRFDVRVPRINQRGHEILCCKIRLDLTIDYPSGMCNGNAGLTIATERLQDIHDRSCIEGSCVYM